MFIGGSGEKVTMKLAPQIADIWNNPTGSEPELPHKIDVLRAHCDAIGRDPASITISQLSLVTIAPDEATLAPMMEKARQLFRLCGQS